MRRLIPLIAAGLVLGLAPAATPAPSPTPTPSAPCDATHWSSYTRPSTFAPVVDQDVRVPMSDGVNLVADVARPEAPAGAKFPVVISQTPYGKQQGPSTYFTERGYVQVLVQVRGTGTSEGTWHAFDAREQRDGYEVVDWAVHQPWSDGRVALFGASYLAINQVFTAAQHPPGLKAIFPIVPEADAYRDIVFDGGQTNVEFIPLWLGLVTATSVAPGSNLVSDPVTALFTIVAHLLGFTSYQVPTVAGATTGSDIDYDGDYWRLRSPISVIDRVDVPTFITGGLHDLFQRGEPLLYEALRRRSIPTKLLMGPWGHLDGSSGAGLPVDDVPSLNDIALRWFDQYVRGVNTNATCLPDVTQYVLGDGHFRVQHGWPNADSGPQLEYLGAGGALSATTPDTSGGTDTLPQNPFNGVCSESSDQWIMGALDSTPCHTDNRITELGEKSFTGPVLAHDLRISGPIAARIWVATTAREAVVVVRVVDVAPDGTATELTTGLLAASFRAMDTARSRWMHGIDLQPWHPFTSASIQAVTPGTPMPLDVEVFPTNALIKAGHRLRIDIGPSDFPHAASPLPAAIAEAGGVLTIFHDAEHPSSVALPVVASSTAGGATTAAAPASSAPPSVAGATATRGARLPATGGHQPLIAALALLALALGARRFGRRDLLGGGERN